VHIVESIEHQGNAAELWCGRGSRAVPSQDQEQLLWMDSNVRGDDTETDSIGGIGLAFTVNSKCVLIILLKETEQAVRVRLRCFGGTLGPPPLGSLAHCQTQRMSFHRNTEATSLLEEHIRY